MVSVCKLHSKKVKRHANISAQIRNSEIAASPWKFNSLVRVKYYMSKGLEMISNRFAKTFVFRQFRYRRVWSEYSVSIRCPHIRVFFFFFVAWKKLYRRLHTHDDAN